MKETQEKKPYKPSMSIGEQVFIILYLMLGFFLIFAAEYHIGCWPGRYADVPMCSEYCWLGMDMKPFMNMENRNERVMQEADPLVPCLPY